MKLSKKNINYLSVHTANFYELKYFPKKFSNKNLITETNVQIGSGIDPRGLGSTGSTGPIGRIEKNLITETTKSTRIIIHNIN